MLLLLFFVCFLWDFKTCSALQAEIAKGLFYFPSFFASCTLWLLSVPRKILFWCLKTPGQTSCSFQSWVAEILHKLFHTSCIVCYRNNSFKFSCRVLLVRRSSSESVTLRFFAQLNRLYLLQLALGHLWQEMGSAMWKGHMCSIHGDRVFYFYIHCDEGGLQGKNPFPDSLSIDQYRILTV